jgi:bacillithiol biosynthesis cysteine-adding enzyme BshC
MKFSSQVIPFERTGQFPDLFLDYVREDEKLRKFYDQPDNDAGFLANSSLSFDEGKRKSLVEVISAQYTQTGISPDAALLKKLSEKNTVTVCTGHQLCLFTGPLYFIYKIISTIKLAAELSEKNIPAVPVYWMATEDHDFEEIAEVNLFGKKLKWELVSSGPVGRLKTDSLKKVLEELKVIIGNSVHADELFEKISRAYRPGRTLAQATREFVHELFNGRIFILDGDNPELKKQFAGMMCRDVEQAIAEKTVNASSSELILLGYHAQVNPRKINLFFMGNGLRERIEEKDGKYFTAGGKMNFTKSELLKEIEAHPENFSPNVVLRPLYQQMILPNIAYVGGPGELSYWLEYLEHFKTAGVLFPILVPRNCALIADRNSLEKWERSGLPVENIFDDIDQSISFFVKNNSGDEIALEDERIQIRFAYEQLRKKVVLQDPTLGAAVDAELQKQMKAIETLEGKMLRAAKLKMETSVNQLRKTREKLLPDGKLQERFENFIPYYLKSGNDFIPMLEDAFGNSTEGVQLLITE